MEHMLNIESVSRETVEKARQIFAQNESHLNEYIDLLLEWNDKINLVSRSVSRETVREHVVHSLIPVVLDLMESYDSWIDTGSGGGLPGAPLAIVQSHKHFFLNDNVRKKMRAVDDIIRRAKIENAETVAKSISLVKLEKNTGIVTKHAFKINDLLSHLGSKPWKTIIMWKGVEGAIQEINASGKNLKFTLYVFDFGDDEEFYEGKGLSSIER